MNTPNPPTEFTIRHVITFEPAPAVRMSKPDPADPRDPSYPVPHVMPTPALTAAEVMAEIALLAPAQDAGGGWYSAIVVLGRYMAGGRYEQAARAGLGFLERHSILTGASPSPRLRLSHRDILGTEWGKQTDGQAALIATSLGMLVRDAEAFTAGRP